MSDIVQPAFGRKGKPAARFDLDKTIEESRVYMRGTEASPDRAEFEKRFPGDRMQCEQAYIAGNSFALVTVAERTDDMCHFFYHTLRYEPDMHLIGEWRELMERINLEDVCGELVAGLHGDWRKKPSYYTALNMEFHQRMAAILQVLSM